MEDSNVRPSPRLVLHPEIIRRFKFLVKSLPDSPMKRIAASYLADAIPSRNVPVAADDEGARTGDSCLECLGCIALILIALAVFGVVSINIY